MIPNPPCPSGRWTRYRPIRNGCGNPWDAASAKPPGFSSGLPAQRRVSSRGKAGVTASGGPEAASEREAQGLTDFDGRSPPSPSRSVPTRVAPPSGSFMAPLQVPDRPTYSPPGQAAKPASVSRRRGPGGRADASEPGFGKAGLFGIRRRCLRGRCLWGQGGPARHTADQPAALRRRTAAARDVRQGSRGPGDRSPATTRRCFLLPRRTVVRSFGPPALARRKERRPDRLARFAVGGSGGLERESFPAGVLQLCSPVVPPAILYCEAEDDRRLVVGSGRDAGVA